MPKKNCLLCREVCCRLAVSTPLSCRPLWRQRSPRPHLGTLHECFTCVFSRYGLVDGRGIGWGGHNFPHGGFGFISFRVQVFLPASWGMVRPRLQTHMGCKWKIVWIPSLLRWFGAGCLLSLTETGWWWWWWKMWWFLLFYFGKLPPLADTPSKRCLIDFACWDLVLCSIILFNIVWLYLGRMFASC